VHMRIWYTDFIDNIYRTSVLAPGRLEVRSERDVVGAEASLSVRGAGKGDHPASTQERVLHLNTKKTRQ